MERTRKPWEAESSKSGRAKMNSETSHRPNFTVKKDRSHTLHDDLLLRSVMGQDNRRNRQRDAYIPTGQREISTSLPNLDVRRPQSTPIPSTSPPIHARIATDSSSHERPTSEPLPRDMTGKPSTSTFSTSLPLGNPSEGSPPPYAPTDWDAFLARVTETPESATYDDLLLLAEVNGEGSSNTRNMGSTEDPFNVSVAQVELLSRRITKEGRAKLKLVIAGVRVDKCGICLTQFRPNEKGAFPECQHCFHETCLQRWVARSSSCPVCRSDLRSS